jgi:hypothetical protein
MATQNPYSSEVRERAVRMFKEHVHCAPQLSDAAVDQSV